MGSSSPADLNLKPGSRILIAGASGGIGREVLRSFSPYDVRIGAQYFQREQELRTELAGFKSARAEVALFQSDLSGAEAAHRLVRSFTEWSGGVDILIQLTGGVSRVETWNEISEENWDHDIAVNLKGPFFLAQAAMQAMQASGGRIILTSTASAQHGGGSTSIVYGMAKAGIEYLAKALARVGAPFNILVNAIAPGFIETDFHTVRMGRTKEQLARRADLIPLKRAGTPREVVGAIAFLASDAASYITGQCLGISGGDWL